MRFFFLQLTYTKIFYCFSFTEFWLVYKKAYLNNICIFSTIIAPVVLQTDQKVNFISSILLPLMKTIPLLLLPLVKYIPTCVFFGLTAVNTVYVVDEGIELLNAALPGQMMPSSITDGLAFFPMSNTTHTSMEIIQQSARHNLYDRYKLVTSNFETFFETLRPQEKSLLFNILTEVKTYTKFHTSSVSRELSIRIDRDFNLIRRIADVSRLETAYKAYYPESYTFLREYMHLITKYNTTVTGIIYLGLSAIAFAISIPMFIYNS